MNIQQIKVQNMTSSRGNKVPNQFIMNITNMEGNSTYFQSYDTIIALKLNGQVILDEGSWDYSVTTGKYRNQFLGENKAVTQKKIDEGIYKLANLNE